MVILTNFGKDMTHKLRKRMQKRVFRVHFHTLKIRVFWNSLYENDIQAEIQVPTPPLPPPLLRIKTKQNKNKKTKQIKKNKQTNKQTKTISCPIEIQIEATVMTEKCLPQITLTLFDKSVNKRGELSSQSYNNNIIRVSRFITTTRSSVQLQGLTTSTNPHSAHLFTSTPCNLL